MDTTGDPGQYLTFTIGDEEYALGILCAREIIQYDTVTRVPRMPGWIRGVINLRGGVVPVLDLAMRFGQAASAVTKSTCIVITEMAAEGESQLVGIVADSVCQVIDLPPGEIEPAPAFGTRVRADYLQGMGRSGRKFVLILDADKILSDAERDEAASLRPAAAEIEPPPMAAPPDAGMPGLA